MFYIARITHNYGNNWEQPSGPKYKSLNKDFAFEAQYKFGFEEWFRCKRHEKDGYQYAYIESLEARHCKAKILLHTIRHNEGNKKSDRTLVGVLHQSDYYTQWNDVSLKEISEEFYPDMRRDLQVALKSLSKVEQLAAIEQLKLHKEFTPDTGKPLFNFRYKNEDLTYIFSRNIDSSTYTQNKRFGIQESNFQAHPELVQKVLLELDLE